MKKYSIDIFVNNAGLGVFGDFTDTDLDRELAELDVNVKAFHTLFKLFLSDVGLLTTIYGKACKLKIVTKEKDVNKGAVYENVVAQELHAHGYSLLQQQEKGRA
mgnify:CR=1 FL=1